jgi:hemolysin activation/secretion protein
VYGGSGLGYARVAWQAPWGASGWDAGVAQSFMHYELGGDFSSLNARGKARDSTLYAITTLQRRRDARLQLNLALDDKRYDDEANGAVTPKRAQTLALNLAGQWPGGTGGAWASAGLVGGRLRLDAASTVADAQSHRTAGSFAKLALQAAHERAMAGALSGELRGSAQWAAKNLDNSEKLALGGPQAVRAYPQGAASCDDALIINAEVRWAIGEWRAALFADYAQGRVWHGALPIDADNSKTLHGIGVRVDAGLPGGVVLQLVAAQPTAGAAGNPIDHGARAWVLVNKTF